MRLVVLVLVIIGSAPAAAGPLVCPSGARLRQERTAVKSRDWCERANGVAHGPYRSYADRTARQIVSEGAYRAGVEHGHFTNWENGRVVYAGTLDNGRRVGAWIEGDPDHQWRGSYCADKRCGEWKLFEGRNVSAAGAYRDSRPHGLWTFWTEGVLVARGPYVSGKKTGTWSYWDFDTRRQETVVTCRASVPHGPMRAWYPNGVPRLLGVYRNGELDGIWRSWDASGTTGWVARYDKGSLVEGDPVDQDMGIMRDGESGRSACEPERFLVVFDDQST